MRHQIRRMVVLAMFLAAACILYVIESMLPLPLPVPGVKWGLSNVVSLLALILFGWRAALCITVLRVCLASLFSGMFLGLSFLMGFSGALVSVLVMTCLYTRRRSGFSVVGISIAGAAVHNTIQILMAAVLVSSFPLLWYWPYLLFCAIPAGFGTGMIAQLFLQKAPKLRDIA